MKTIARIIKTMRVVVIVLLLITLAIEAVYVSYVMPMLQNLALAVGLTALVMYGIELYLSRRYKNQLERYYGSKKP